MLPLLLVVVDVDGMYWLENKKNTSCRAGYGTGMMVMMMMMTKERARDFWSGLLNFYYFDE